MKPIKFKEVNKDFAKNQPEYFTLPAFHDWTQLSGPVVTCWKPTLRERFRILFGGKVWMMLLTFNRALTPSNLSIRKTDFIKTDPSKFE